MAKEGYTNLKIRPEKFNRAEQKRDKIEKETGLTTTWGEILHRGIITIHDAYADTGNNTLSDSEVFDILDRETSRGKHKNIGIKDELVADMNDIKGVLKDEWGVKVSWGDILEVGIEEMYADITRADEDTDESFTEAEIRAMAREEAEAVVDEAVDEWLDGRVAEISRGEAKDMLTTQVKGDALQ